MSVKRKTKGFLLLYGILTLTLVTLIFGNGTAKAAAGINPQLSFEGKIVNSSGLNIADGTYNMEFKIYQDGNSSGVGSTLKWTEDRLVGGAGGVTFSSGTFQVNLGSVNAFGSSVDWNQDTLWLSLQVGNTSSCTISTDFHTDCSGDGEMTPFIRLTSTPYAFNADKLDGIDSSTFVQLGASQSGNINIGSGTINSGAVNGISIGSTIQPSSAGALTVQANGSNALTLTGGTASTWSTSSGLLTIQGGSGLALKSSNGTSSSDVSLKSGDASSGASGNITIDNGTFTSGTPTIAIGNSAQAHTINIGTGAADQDISIGSATSGSTLTLQSANSVSLGTSITANSAATGTTALTGTAATNTTTLVVSNTNFANGDILFIDNANTDYFTRVVSGGGTSTLTVYPAINYQSSRTVTKYTAQNIGATASDYSTQSNEFYQGNYLGGVAVGPVGQSVIFSKAGIGFETAAVQNTTPTFTIQGQTGNSGSGVGGAVTIVGGTGGGNGGLLTLLGGNPGSSSNSDGGVTIDSGNGASTPNGTINIGNNYAKTINIGTSVSVDQNLTIGNSGGTSATAIQGGTGNVAVTTGANGSGTAGNITFTTGTSSSGNASITAKSGSNSTTAFQVQNSDSGNVISVDTTGNNGNATTTLVGSNKIGNSSVETAIAAANGNWQLAGSATVTKDSTQSYDGANSLKVAATSAANDGAKQVLNATLASSTAYTMTFYGKLDSGTVSMSDLQVGYSYDSSSAHESNCTANTATLIANGWTKITCSFTTGSSGTAPTSTNYVYVRKTNSSTAETFYLDAFRLQTDASHDTNYREGKLSIQAAIVSPLILQNSANSTNALAVQNSGGTGVLVVDTTDTNLVSNPSFEANTTGWSAVSTSTISRDVTNGYYGTNALQVVNSSVAGGAQFSLNPVVTLINTQYTVSFFIKLISGTPTALTVTYSPEGTTTTNTCAPTGTAVTGGWQRFTCSIAADASHAPTTGGYLKIAQASGTSTWDIDGVQMEYGGSATPYNDGTFQLNGSVVSPAIFQNTANSTTAFAVDNASGSSLFGVDTLNSQTLLGSSSIAGKLVLYDGTGSGNFITLQTTGSMSTSYTIKFPTAGPTAASQCLQSSGSSPYSTLVWGSCGGAGGATHKVTLVPEYPGAIIHAGNISGVTCNGNSGNLTSDWDSTNNHNYYVWYSTQSSLNCYDIVTRSQVPSDYSSTFGSFTVNIKADSTSTSNNDINIKVVDNTAGQTCQSGTSLLSGITAGTWAAQAVTVSGCTVSAGDMLTIEVTVSSKSSNNVYLGEVSYTYST